MWHISYNGTAVEGGYVTWRSIRFSVLVASMELSRCEPGMARVFARPGTPVVGQVVSRGISHLVAGNSPVMVCLVKSTERWLVFVMVP